VDCIEVAVTMAERMRGLLGRPRLEPGHGMHILRCASIHTCFMQFSIDLIFLDSRRRVVTCRSNVRPWRMVWGGRGSASVIEIASGWFDASLITVGDALDFIDR